MKKVLHSMPKVSFENPMWENSQIIHVTLNAMHQFYPRYGLQLHDPCGLNICSKYSDLHYIGQEVEFGFWQKLFVTPPPWFLVMSKNSAAMRKKGPSLKAHKVLFSVFIFTARKTYASSDNWKCTSSAAALVFLLPPYSSQKTFSS